MTNNRGLNISYGQLSNGMVGYYTDMQSLKSIGASEFDDNTWLEVSNYLLNIKFGGSKKAVRTEVYSTASPNLPQVRKGDLPQYIRTFIYR